MVYLQRNINRFKADKQEIEIIKLIVTGTFMLFVSGNTTKRTIFTNIILKYLRIDKIN